MRLQYIYILNHEIHLNIATGCVLKQGLQVEFINKHPKDRWDHAPSRDKTTAAWSYFATVAGFAMSSRSAPLLLLATSICVASLNPKP